MRAPSSPPPLRPPVPPSRSPDRALTTWESLIGKPETLPAAGIAIALSDIPKNASATRKFLESASSSIAAWDTLLLADLPTNSSATRKLLSSVSSGAAIWDTLVAADVTGDVAATRKFLRSLGSGASPGATVWDTLTAADIGAGTFPSGTFTFPGTVDASIIKANNQQSDVATQPTDVSVPSGSATTLFAANNYITYNDATLFAFGDTNTIAGCGVVTRAADGTVAVALLVSRGSGVALSVSGQNVQLTQTTGATRTVHSRVGIRIGDS
jgi:hypothetical protein